MQDKKYLGLKMLFAGENSMNMKNNPDNADPYPAIKKKFCHISPITPSNGSSGTRGQLRDRGRRL